ncbi:MAG TPA: hypothetical protein VI703_00535 [Anaerolineales bacterium]|nr:hypothetical protein [Anaerolineales bacterium]
MPRYLIEVPHEDTEGACNRAIQIFRATGSHFVTHAEWGCHDNEHKAWMLVDLDDKQQALAIIPPEFRAIAKVTAVERLSPAQLETIAKEHNS